MEAHLEALGQAVQIGVAGLLALLHIAHGVQVHCRVRCSACACPFLLQHQPLTVSLLHGLHVQAEVMERDKANNKQSNSNGHP